MRDDPNPNDLELIRLIDEQYAPEPMTAHARAELQQRLEDGIARRKPRPIWIPALATVVPLLIAGLLIFQLAGPDPPVSEPGTEAQTAWGQSVFYPDEMIRLEGTGDADSADFLPEDYYAIETVLFSG